MDMNPSKISYSDCPAGMELWGVLPERDQELLRFAYEESLSRLAGEWRQSLARKQTFWINLWQRSGGGERVPLGRIDELDAFSRELAHSVYGRGHVEFDGYGWSVNPAGSQSQEWHIDYTFDYSTIFIPLTRLTEQNCIQYAVLPANISTDLKARATLDLDQVDMGLLCRESDWVSIRQLVVKPYSVVKMDFKTIHRGVANSGDSDRVLFWISVKQGVDLLPAEPLVERIDDRH